MNIYFVPVVSALIIPHVALRISPEHISFGSRFWK
uniref:Uncharacterized protein n=1 Tax=Arundo donax TaxID=35708 RepID=A0A0A8YJW6_ARUDO